MYSISPISPSLKPRMASSFGTRRVGITAATHSCHCRQLLQALRDPYVSSSDLAGRGKAVKALQRKITDPVAVVPSCAIQESYLVAANSSNPLDILVAGGVAAGCGVALDAVTRGLRVGLGTRRLLFWDVIPLY